MKTRYKHFINVYHWDKPDELLYKFSKRTSLKEVENMMNISSKNLPSEFPFEFSSPMDQLRNKCKRSDGYDYKIVIQGCVSFCGKPFGRCAGLYCISGRAVEAWQKRKNMKGEIR